jgi:hypothetical protein
VRKPGGWFVSGYTWCWRNRRCYPAGSYWWLNPCSDSNCASRPGLLVDVLAGEQRLRRACRLQQLAKNRRAAQSRFQFQFAARSFTNQRMRERDGPRSGSYQLGPVCRIIAWSCI